MSSTLKCVLHIRSETNDKVIPFTHHTLKRCREKNELRRKIQKRKSKFDKIVLPIEPDGSGYHALCYKFFASIHAKNVGSGKSQTILKLV